MKRKLLLLTSLLLVVGNSVYAEEVEITENNVHTHEIIEEEKEEEVEKRWSFKTGIKHSERQQGRVSSKYYDPDNDYTGADDLNEDGDVTSIFTSLGYKINDKWSVDYKYSYDYIDNNATWGRDSDKDSGQFITHTARIIRSFEEFNLLGKEWNSSVWIGGRSYRESSINQDGASHYRGFTSNRFLANANMNTDLTEKTHLDLNYNYQFRDYDYDDGNPSTNQHRHYLSVTVDHQFNEAWYISIGNTLYLRQEVGESRNYGEWDYDYTIGHIYPLKNGYSINTELTAWGELGLWEKGYREVQSHDQAELVFMPKIKKTFELEDDMNISAFFGTGYVYGYDTRTNRTQYKGFEARVGAVYSYDF